MSARTAAVGGPDGERWRVPQVGATVWRGQAAQVGGGGGEWSEMYLRANKQKAG